MKIKLLFLLAVSFFIVNTVSATMPLEGRSEMLSESRLNSAVYHLDDGDFITGGYLGLIEGGFSLGVGAWGKGFISLSTTHGYRFNSHLFLGAGVGVNFYMKNPKNFYFSEFGIGPSRNGTNKPINFPVFVHPRVYFLKGNTSPFLDAKVGYSFGDLDGFYFNPSLGVVFDSGKKGAINLGVGYTMQLFNLNMSGIVARTRLASGIMIKLGVEF